MPAIVNPNCGEERRSLVDTHHGEELQLEISSRIYAADWSLLERIAQFLKAEYEGKTKLAVAKHVAQRLEEGIAKLEATEVVPYLEDVKKLLTENHSLTSRAKV